MLKSTWLFTVALVAIPSYADWQYAKFGMTPEQVVAASGGKATPKEEPKHHRRRGDNDLGRALVIADYSFKTFEFNVFFIFDPTTSKLNAVTLDLKNPNDTSCWALTKELRDTYGPPDSSEKGVLTRFVWRSEKSNNLVTNTDIGGGRYCSLDYEPLPTPTSGGL